MIISITIPDAIYAKYSERNPENPRKEIEKTLEKFSDVPVSDRLLLVPPDVRRELEKLVGGPIEKWEKFLRIFRDALSIRAGEVNVPLSEGQVKRVSDQVRFYKREPKEYLEELLKRGVNHVLGGA